MAAGGVSAGAIYAEASLDIGKFQQSAGQLAVEAVRIAGAMETAARGIEATQAAMNALGGAALSGLAAQLNGAAEGMAAAGARIVERLAEGMQSSGSAQGAAASVAAGVKSAYAAAASGAAGIGANFTAGLANGIRAGRSGVVNAAKSVAEAAARAARRALDIHSPSGVTEQYGRYFDMGFVRGVRGGMPQIDRAVEQAVYLRAPVSTWNKPAERAERQVSMNSVPAIDYGALAEASAARPTVMLLDGREVARGSAETTAQFQNARSRGIAARYGTR